LFGAAVNLIRQDIGPGGRDGLNEVFEGGLIHQRAGGIAGIGQRNQLGVGSEQGFERIEIGQKPVFFAQVQRGDLGPLAFGNGVMLLVARADRHDVIARMDQRFIDQRVGPDRAMGGDDVVLCLARVKRGDGVAQAGGALDGAVGHGAGHQLRQGVIIAPRKLGQLGERDGGHAGFGKVQRAVVFIGVHPHLDAELADFHVVLPFYRSGGRRRAASAAHGVSAARSSPG